MLNKDICKRCVEENFGHWNRLNENDWNKGRVACPHRGKLKQGKRSICNEPPERCAYSLEHMLCSEVEYEEVGVQTL